jgi:hypothetical protein
MGIIIALNITTLLNPSPVEKYISFNDVNGIEVVHNKIPYTLNFEQQNKLLEYLNVSLPIGKEKFPSNKESLDFDKIVIYRFGAPEITLIPLAYYQQNLIYEAPGWNPKGYMQDISEGQLRTLISQTYDP